MGGRLSGVMVTVLDCISRGPGSNVAGFLLLQSGARHFTLTMLLLDSISTALLSLVLIPRREEMAGCMSVGSFSQTVAGNRA